MRIVFFGNGNFAVNPLKSLINSKYNVSAIVTNKPNLIKRRGGFKQTTPVYQYSKENNLKILSFNDVNGQEALIALTKIKADLFVVVEFKKLHKTIFNIPRYGTINIHASILPTYRGAAPIQRSIINGENKIGLTSFFINDIIDTGDIVHQKTINIDDKITYGDCYNNLSFLSKKFILESIKKIINNDRLQKQTNLNTSYAKKITKEDCKITFNTSAFNVHNKVRGLYPKPGAYAIISNKRIKLIDTYYENISDLNVGEYFINNKILHIGCNKGMLLVKYIQFENKKIISANDFSNMTNLKDLSFE